MTFSLSTGSPAADVLLGLGVVAVFVVWLLAAESAVWLLRGRNRRGRRCSNKATRCG